MPQESPSIKIQILRVVMPVFGLTCLFIFPPWDGITAWISPLPGSVQEQVEDAIDHGLDGIIVYVDQPGIEPLLYAAGWKNRAAQLPADPQALFKIASISKLYVAAATVRLINRGVLSLDSLLVDLSPGVDGRIENADQISLRMLLRHRSGIPNFTDQSDFDWSRSPADIGENLSLIFDKPADFEPDAQYAYSNTNYLLIGRILDRVLGYDHQRFIESEFLIPLGLSNTHGSLEHVNIEDVVSGYHKSYDEDWRAVRYLSASGAMVATAQDVGVFLRALNDGSLLTDDEQVIYSAIYEYEHTGWVLGYQSIARYHKDIDAVVIQFVNTTSGNGESELTANVIYDRIIRILRS